MNRREAIGAGLAMLLPTWKLRWEQPQAIALQDFCDDPAAPWTIRYNMAEPFVQPSNDRLFKFATDGKIALRVNAIDYDCGDEQERRPPIGDLNFWQHDSLRGWKPWPKEDRIVAADSKCPTCNGYGTASGKVGKECDVCYGCGYEIPEGGMDRKRCSKCNGHEVIGPYCPVCKGNAYGTHASIQKVGDILIDVGFDKKIRSNLRDVEYTILPFRTPSTIKTAKEVGIVAFRFLGGVGVLMPLDPELVGKRIEAAKAVKRG